MTTAQPRITPCLWFDDRAEEAVAQYTAIFPNSKVLTRARYDAASAEVSGRPEGSGDDGRVRARRPARSWRSTAVRTSGSRRRSR